MAKKKAAAKEVERKVLSNGVILIKYDDGSYAFLTPISAEDAEEIFGGEFEDSDDEDEDDESEDGEEDSDDEDEDDESEDGEEDEDDDEDEEEDDEVTPEDLAGMDFEALEDLCDDKELEPRRIRRGGRGETPQGGCQGAGHHSAQGKGRFQ
jgi:hypothetical protein